MDPPFRRKRSRSLTHPTPYSSNLGPRKWEASHHSKESFIKDVRWTQYMMNKFQDMTRQIEDTMLELGITRSTSWDNLQKHSPEGQTMVADWMALCGEHMRLKRRHTAMLAILYGPTEMREAAMSERKRHAEEDPHSDDDRVYHSHTD
jgi:hypothetical protein